MNRRIVYLVHTGENLGKADVERRNWGDAKRIASNPTPDVLLVERVTSDELFGKVSDKWETLYEKVGI